MSAKTNKGPDESDSKGKEAAKWIPEEAIDLEARLTDLINEPPFKEVSSGGEESVTIAARVPMWLYRRIVKAKEFAGSPYDINSDVVRDSIYLGMRIIQMRYRETADWAVETRLASTVDAVSAGRRMRQQVGDLVEGLEELYRDGDTVKAAQSLSEYVAAANEIEDNWHRTKLFDMLAENKVVRSIASHCSKDIQKLIREGRPHTIEGEFKEL